jgi:thioredoxin-related protein
MRKFAGWVCALALVAMTSARAGGDWIENFEEAKAKAAKEGKDLLIDFTGSDWCGWCIKLKEEVFDKDAFLKEAKKNYIFVELDFPRGKAQSPEIKAQNEKLQGQFAIQGFPTIVLTDAKGLPYAKTGYQPGGPEAYLKHLGELKGQKAKRDELFADAEKLQGVEKAKALDKVLEHLAQMDLADVYTDVMKQIIDLDAKNEAGLKGKVATRMKLMEAGNLAQSGKFDDALKVLDAEVAKGETKDVELLKLHFLRAQILNNKGDEPGTLKALEQARDAAPNSEDGKKMAEIIEKVKEEKAKRAK